jgi:hypothetical protein
MAKFGAQPEVENRGSKVISLVFSLYESKKLIKYWSQCVTAKDLKFIMILGK